MGMQDIYQVVFPNSQLDNVIVHGVVADLMDEPVKARILLTDATGEEIVGVYNTNEKTGRFLMVLTPEAEYSMTVEAPGFVTRTSTSLRPWRAKAVRWPWTSCWSRSMRAMA
jgi:hypothetical protein